MTAPGPAPAPAPLPRGRARGRHRGPLRRSLATAARTLLTRRGRRDQPARRPGPPAPAATADDITEAFWVATRTGICRHQFVEFTPDPIGIDPEWSCRTCPALFTRKPWRSTRVYRGAEETIA